MINFFPSKEICTTKQKEFGLCDAPAQSKAYIDHCNREEWIAVVYNENQKEIGFVPVDHCIDLRKPDGKMDNRCDCCLFHKDTIAFVELKRRKPKCSDWIKDGEKQLRSTIAHFENENVSKQFCKKSAYIANSMQPNGRRGQNERMERFFNDTGYVLRIKNTIEEF